MHKRFGPTPLALMLLVTLLGACSDSGNPSQDPSNNEVGATAGNTGSPSSGTSQQSDGQPPIDPQAIAFLEVTFTIKGTDQGAPEVPFEIRWEEEGKPSSTDARTLPDGTRRIQFDHGSRLAGLVIHPSARTAPSVYKESALLMGGRTHQIHVELEPGGIVSGIVLDIDGNPVPKAEVGAYFTDAMSLDKIASPRVTAFTYSDEQGKFRLGGLPRGPFILEASGPNMMAVWRPGGVMSEVKEYRDLEILLEPGHVVYGQVTDSMEQPIGGVSITAGKPSRRVNRLPTQYPEIFMHGPRACLAQSDADGLFTLNAVPESQGWNINAKHPLYLPVHTSFDAGQQDVWLELKKGAVLAGKVEDANGEPVVSAQIWLLSASGQPTVFSDRNGIFLFSAGQELHGVSPLIYKQGYGMVFLPPMDVVTDTPPLAVVLDGGVTIHGKVVDAGGNGVSGVPMRISGTPPHESYLAAHMPERFLDRDAVLTAPDGSFEFTELYDSVFTVTARPSGQAAVKLEGVSATSTDVVLTIK